MLIEFSVSNFRSFRERQTLSMVAATRLKKRENVFAPNIKEKNFPALLKVAVIYGPNASGKSNLLKALDVVRTVSLRIPDNSDLPLPVVPFRFDPELADKASVFELHFIHDEMRYEFDVALTRDRVMQESLYAYPGGKETLVYSREFIGHGDKYLFGELLTSKLSEPVLAAWQSLTPPKNLFIAQAVANTSDTPSPLNGPFSWLKTGIQPMLYGMSALATASQELVESSDMHGDAVAQFLREVDVPIAKIRVTKDETSPIVNQLLLSGGKRPRIAQRTFLTHQSALGDADLSYDDESEGTRNLIGFWLPWVTKEYRNRCVLAVDEMDSSLHPKIVAALVEKHIHSPAPTQLIFTTHDTHLMDAKLLRRDQFWITERDANGATQLRAIHEFEGREGEDIEKRYYEGRYRGLPLLKRK